MRISKKILKRQLAHTSGDNSKQAIQGILIDGNKTVATDGYRLSIVEHKVGISGKAFVTNEIIKAILSVKFKKSQIDRIPDIDCVEIDTNKLTYFTGVELNQATIELQDATHFPAYDHVIPQGEPVPITTIGLNVKLLGEMIPNDANFVSIQFYGELKPIVATATANGLAITNVVMPIRIAE